MSSCKCVLVCGSLHMSVIARMSLYRLYRGPGRVTCVPEYAICILVCACVSSAFLLPSTSVVTVLPSEQILRPTG